MKKASRPLIKSKATEGELPTQAERDLILAEIRVQQDTFHPLDVRELVNNKAYLDRFWLHSYYMPNEQISDCISLIQDTFRWREDFGVRTITEDDLDDDDKKNGSIYTYGRDLDGSKLLIFCVRKHFKDSSKSQKRRKAFVYLLERLQQEENGGKISIMFDCASGGVRNMDIEIIQFVIQVMVQYYPDMVNYIIVFEMPWVLNAAWKIIKSLLPAPAAKKIKFTNKETLEEYVDKSEQLVEWGGTNTWTYAWQSEAKPHNATLDGGGAEDTVGLMVKPESFLEFKSQSSDSLEATIELSNNASQRKVFKVKTTSPDMFRVRPHTAFILPNQSTSVRIFTSPGVDLKNEKFQILSTLAPEAVQKSVSECFRSGDKFQEVRLYCREPNQTMANAASPSSVESRLPSVSRVVSEMNMKMDACQDILEKQRMINIMLLLLNLYILYTFFRYTADIKC